MRYIVVKDRMRLPVSIYDVYGYEQPTKLQTEH